MTATFQIFDPTFTRNSSLLGGYASDITINTPNEIQLMSGQRFFQGGPITHYGTITLLGSNLFSSFGASNPGLHGTVTEIDLIDLSGNLVCKWSGMTLDASFLTPFPSTDPSQEIISAGVMSGTTFPLSVIGGQGDADLYGNLGDDTINGAGNDHIDGISGINTIYGGTGHDVIVDFPFSFGNGSYVVGGYIDGGSGFSTLQLSQVNLIEIDDSSGKTIWTPGDPTIRAQAGAAVTVKVIVSQFPTFAGTVSVVDVNEINGIKFASAAPSISIGDAPPVIEGTTGPLLAAFPVTLSGASSTDTVTVHYATEDGSAIAGTDYTAESGTITLAPGQNIIYVPVTQETIAAEKTFNVVLSSPTDSNGSVPAITNLVGVGTIEPNSSLTIAGADKSESGTVSLGWRVVPPAPGNLVLKDVEITQPQKGVIHFSDTDPNARPFASIVGAPTITATDLQGNAVTLTSSQMAILQTAFTISPEAGNTNDGAIDWTFNFRGAPGDLDFLAGRTVIVQNTVKVEDQVGKSDTATVTNTLTVPPTGIDYRYHNQDGDPLGASQISKTFSFVGEYLGANSNNGYLSYAQAKEYIHAGLQIFSIYETAGSPNPSYYTLQQGLVDGAAAAKNAQRVHQTPGSPIYFAVDYDPGTNLNGVISYFEGVNQALNKNGPAVYSVGVYGAGITLATIKDAVDPKTGTHLASYGWLAESPGWTGSRTYSNWNLEQIFDPVINPKASGNALSLWR